MGKFDAINNALDMDAEIVTQSQPKKLVTIEDSVDIVPSSKDDAEKDYNYTRANLLVLMEKGQEAIAGALELAQDGDSARSYEVALNGIKSMSEVAEKLMDLQKKVKDLNDDSVKTHQTNITNNEVFIGTTAQVQKIIEKTLINKLPPS